jgi:hypothetical protein
VSGVIVVVMVLLVLQVEVLVTVHNRMTGLPVDFVFEALSGPSGRRQTGSKAAASPSLVW